MSSRPVLSAGVAVGFIFGLFCAAFPQPAYATHQAFHNVGTVLRTITPTDDATVLDPTIGPSCDSQGGTSMAVVLGSKLAGVDPARYPVLLAVSCLDNGAGGLERRLRVNFLDPGLDPVTGLPSGKIVKSLKTNVADATSKPTLTTIAGTALATGTYNVRYTYRTATGETLPSPRATIVLSSGGNRAIRVTVPRPAGAVGTAVIGIGVYISLTPAIETKQTPTCTILSSTIQCDQSSFLVAGAALPTSNTTVFTADTGWAHWVNRADRADLLACVNNGTISSIDYNRFNAVTDGGVTSLPRPSGLGANCGGMGWDAEEDMIYQAVSTSVVRFKEGTTTLVPFPSGGTTTTLTTPCPPTGLAITGGVLVVTCENLNTVYRLNKETGAILSPNGMLGALGLPAGTTFGSAPDFGDLACDPVTFYRDSTGKDQFKDAIWSRNGLDGNGAVALEFPAFTCGLPANATVLAAGLSAPGTNGPGEVPKTACLNAGAVIDADGDGLPDCWETSGIDFDGDGNTDLTLCVQVPVDANGDGVYETTQECATADHKDLFVEVDYMQGTQTGQDRSPNLAALSQAESGPLSVANIGVTSVRKAFAAAPVEGLPGSGVEGIRIHFQVDEKVTFTTLANPPSTKNFVTELVFTPCTPPAKNPDGTLNAVNLDDAADFDTIKKANFGTFAERNSGLNSVNILNAKRLAFRYMLFAYKQVGLNQGGASYSGCAELGGDDSAITLGALTNDKDQQAGTVMHEFGHNLGLDHGGGDAVNCKPNYRSVMSYSRQFSNSPIPNRRLDYSRAKDPELVDPDKTGHLDEASLDEIVGLGLDQSLAAIPNPANPAGVPFFPADQTAYGPNGLSVVPAAGQINWNKNKFTTGSNKGNPIFDALPVSADINSGSSSCDGSGMDHEGHDDWSNLHYRASAALDFGAGIHTTVGFVPPGIQAKADHVSITSEQENELFLAGDLDPLPDGPNGVPDALDCGGQAWPTTAAVAVGSTSVSIGGDPATLGFPSSGKAFLSGTALLGETNDDFLYTGTTSTGFTGVTGISKPWPAGTIVTLFGFRSHRIDIKPADPTNTVTLGQNVMSVGIFSEVCPSGAVWNAPAEVQKNATLTFSVGSLVLPVKVNNNGQGTCSERDLPDPVTGQKDGIKDLICSFPTTGLLTGGPQIGIASGLFLDPFTNEVRAFRARQEFIVAQ